MERETLETKVKVKLRLFGEGKNKVETGIGFLNHLLETFSVHSLMDLQIKAHGDLKHHVVEDVAISLGRTIRKALRNRNVRRFGFSLVPMDDSLALAAVDLVERSYPVLELGLKGGEIEDLKCEDFTHFLETLIKSMEATIHLKVLHGFNDHHKAEAVFKAFAIAFSQAIQPRKKGKVSVKGTV